MSPSEPLESTNLKRNRRLLFGSGALALLAGASFATWKFRLHDTSSDKTAVVYQQSFPWVSGPSKPVGPAADGQDTRFALSSLRGKFVLLNFWATWCPPCVEEMPELSELAESWQKSFPGKVATVGLAIDSVANVSNFSQKMPVKYDLLAANTEGLELVRILGNQVGALPFTVILGPEGQIFHRILGKFQKPALDSQIRKLLR
jgi:thiol-disulfide isomerase/thioredoxin